MKTHWLYGQIDLKEEILKETNCQCCSHVKVCSIDMSKRCVNYKFGSSIDGGLNSCTSCEHKYTRFDKDNIYCFKCGEFDERK